MSLLYGLLESVQRLHESDDERHAVTCADCGDKYDPETVCKDCGRCQKCQESYKPAPSNLTEELHISDDNSKTHCPNVSHVPVIGCHHHSPCRNGNCYACSFFARLPATAANWLENYEEWYKDPAGYEATMAAYLARHHPERFRYMVAGDIPDDEYLQMAARLADANPGTKFAMYSKMHELDLGKYRRPNLCIIRSMWPGYSKPDPTQPQAWMKDKEGEETRIPADSFKCPCGPDDPGCGVVGKHGEEPCVKCWDLKPGENVHFEEHGSPVNPDNSKRFSSAMRKHRDTMKQFPLPPSRLTAREKAKAARLASRASK